MKTFILCFSLFALFRVNQGYVVERTIPIPFDDPELFNDFFNLTTSLQDSDIYKATVNNFAERILTNLNKFLKKDGMDPLPMDDIKEGYWWGYLKLKKLQITGLSTLYRPNEDAVLTYNHHNKQLQFDLPMSVGDLKFTCKYKAALMFMGPSGKLTAEVSDLLMRTSLVIDYNVNQAFLRMFEIPNSGHIKIHIRDFILTDWFYNLLSDAMTAIFKKYILDAVGGAIQTKLSSIMDVVDQILQAILG